jgi:hypothetical protein
MKKELTREQMIKLIASDYGFGEEITKKIKTEILRDVCNASQSNVYLKGLLDFGSPDIYLED